MKDAMLAGELQIFGDSIIGTLSGWSDAGLKTALTTIVVITVARKVSLKAGIGALIAMVIALGIYDARDALSGKVTDEVKNPAKGAGVTVVITPDSATNGRVL
ncbi:hypothetical protein J7I97_32095 [Streptomyces sp. ISL-87]|uniref:hypothetical protein n=1 Tax=Streptomyces sp. ISL-87 TaxID=2819188 RepID=UPI001BE8DF2C|nr:hypothetical protein [Streptomyces sp. ISL-87]MBT2612739.1 hypothetical protein [Streptomyces sp. ISL-87]